MWVFQCPRCDGLLDFKNNTLIVNDIEGKIKVAEKENDDIFANRKKKVPKKKAKVKSNQVFEKTIANNSAN